MAAFKCRLNVILAEIDMSKGEFAKRIHVSPGTVSLICNNKSLPSFETIYAILEELNLRMNEVWQKED